MPDDKIWDGVNLRMIIYKTIAIYQLESFFFNIVSYYCIRSKLVCQLNHWFFN